MGTLMKCKGGPGAMEISVIFSGTAGWDEMPPQFSVTIP